MQNSNKTFRTSAAMAAVLLLGLHPPAPAQAQTGTTVEEIVVTGSYIRRDGFDSASPMDILDEAALAAAAAPTMGDIVQNLTMNTGSQVQSDFSATGDFATTQFNLRGLGFGATLTLVNGRRVTQNSGGGSFVDVNQFPVNMIERIEILKDGAAAIYGSDAVAGVVNLVTRRVDGFEAEIGYQTTTDMQTAMGESDDTQDMTFNGAFGIDGERGNLDIFFSHLYRTDVNDTEQFNGNITSFGYPGAFRLLESPADGPYAGIPPGVVIQDPDCGSLGGLNPSPNGTGLCRINLAPTSFSFIPAERRSALFTQASFELTDSLRAFSEFSYAHYDVEAIQNETNSISRQLVVVPANHPDNIFGVPVHFLGRPTVAGRTIKYLNNNVRAMAGLSYEFGDDWHAELGYVHSQNTIDRTSIRTFVDDVQAALNGVGGPGGNYRLNPFGSAVTGEGTPNDPALIEWLSIEIPAFRETTLKTVDFHATGPVLDLPAGPLSVAFGGQYRIESMEQLNDSSRLRDIDGQYAPAMNFPKATADVWAGFLEVSVPVLETLELSAAVRHEDFGGGIGSTTDPKVSLRWQSPIDTLSLRGSYSSSFRGPSILETSTPLRSTSAQIVDPFSGAPGQCNGDTTVVIRENYSGNPNLKPETSKNYNFGIVVTPLQELRASIDYWRYEYTDIVGQVGAQGIVDEDCFDDGIRNDPRVNLDPTGTLILDVQTSFFNRARLETDGLDFTATYGFDTSERGSFTFGTNASYILSLESQADPFGPVADGVGSRNRNNSLPPAPELRGNVFAGWSAERHSANLIMRYVDGLYNDRNPDDAIASMTTLDTQYTYTLDGFHGTDVGLKLTVGVKNIFDRKAPHLLDEFTGFLSNIHDPRGRIAYMKVKAEF